MTKWDRLLVALDKVFGFENRARSTVKKRRQLFDEKTNEHVFIIEYRVLRGEHSDPRRREEASIQRRVNQEKVNSLLRDINDDAATLIRLSKSLFATGVLPYYLHQLDRVKGAAHFEVDTAKALRLAREISAALPGYLVPRLVRELPGQPGKTLLGPA